MLEYSTFSERGMRHLPDNIYFLKSAFKQKKGEKFSIPVLNTEAKARTIHSHPKNLGFEVLGMGLRIYPKN